MYKSLKKVGTLTAQDEFVVMADKETAERLATFGMLKDAKIYIIPKPSSILDGMRYKYIFPLSAKIPDGTVCVYLDTDLIAVRPIHTYIPKDYLCLFPEGKWNDTNYCGDPVSDGTTSATPNGYTAGFFAYSLGERTRGFFQRVLKAIELSSKTYYTLDQPFFNKNLDMRFVVEYDTTTLSFNGHTNIDKCRYINLCGEPGDQLLHFDKMLQIFLSVF